ncbi:hypothetical protein HGA92_01020 [Candidatus Gracilibacteria bacterium]|nr:hypothetical protein [Candidatus Gracilibacteria bacterium]NUJ98808.1 hypothetical protein [Candidatus Gracilibacteria bacterium]
MTLMESDSDINPKISSDGEEEGSPKTKKEISRVRSIVYTILIFSGLLGSIGSGIHSFQGMADEEKKRKRIETLENEKEYNKRKAEYDTINSAYVCNEIQTIEAPNGTHIEIKVPCKLKETWYKNVFDFNNDLRFNFYNNQKINPEDERSWVSKEAFREIGQYIQLIQITTFTDINNNVIPEDNEVISKKIRIANNEDIEKYDPNNNFSISDDSKGGRIITQWKIIQAQITKIKRKIEKKK